MVTDCLDVLPRTLLHLEIIRLNIRAEYCLVNYTTRMTNYISAKQSVYTLFLPVSEI